MIIFGSYHALLPVLERAKCDPNNIVVYNINSPVSSTKYNISSIFPSVIPEGVYPGEYSYDVYLRDYILNNDIAFCCLMNIIYSDYSGYLVCVTIDKSWWSLIYIESLIKFIQIRYGVTVNLINEPEDLDSCKQTEYSIDGRQQLQSDKERFIYLNYNQFMDEVEDDNYE